MSRALHFLSAAQVVEMHDVLLARWGGHSGGGHRGISFEGVEAAVQAVKNSYYETIEELAAAYAVYLVQGHVFLDGNKRTGAAAMLVFLEGNGVRCALAMAGRRDLMIDLQRRSEEGEDTSRLIAWIARLVRGD